jgi:hypothetical protein
MARLFTIESGGNPYARTGSNRGLGQFGPREEAQYGINDSNRTDPNVQKAAVLAEAENNRAKLAAVLGREPTAADYYLAHQQGAAGAPALFSHPDMPAWQAIRQYYPSDAIAQRAITGNIPTGSPLYGRNVNDIKSSDFTNYWNAKFNGIPAAAPPILPTGQNVPAGTAMPSSVWDNAMAMSKVPPDSSYWSTLPPPQAQVPSGGLFGALGGGGGGLFGVLAHSGLFGG